MLELYSPENITNILSIHTSLLQTQHTRYSSYSNLCFQILMKYSLEFAQWILFNSTWKRRLSLLTGSLPGLSRYFCYSSAYPLHISRRERSPAHIEHRNEKSGRWRHNCPGWPPRTGPCWSCSTSQTAPGRPSSKRETSARIAILWLHFTSSRRLEIETGDNSSSWKYSRREYSFLQTGASSSGPISDRDK